MAQAVGDPKHNLATVPLPWVGLPSTSSGCSGSHPTWPWMLLEMGYLYPLWAACSNNELQMDSASYKHTTKHIQNMRKNFCQLLWFTPPPVYFTPKQQIWGTFKCLSVNMREDNCGTMQRMVGRAMHCQLQQKMLSWYPASEEHTGVLESFNGGRLAKISIFTKHFRKI